MFQLWQAACFYEWIYFFKVVQAVGIWSLKIAFRSAVPVVLPLVFQVLFISAFF
jgi:hypothetical protein